MFVLVTLMFWFKIREKLSIYVWVCFTTLVLFLSTLKFWFYFSTSIYSSSLLGANFQKCIFIKQKMRMTNIFHMPPQEAMWHVLGLRYSSFRDGSFLADCRRRVSRNQNWGAKFSPPGAHIKFFGITST